MVVAHRNLLSLYDMGSRSCWIDTIGFSRNDHVHDVKIKKRPKHDRYERLELRKVLSHQIYKKQYISVLQKYELAC